MFFSFDLSFWRNKGHWKEKYIPHSLVSDNQVVANISASVMQLQINGIETQAVQLGSVGVLPEFRGIGLSRVLMERVLDEYNNYPLIFLFASEDVSQFYTKFGFRRVDESIPYINIVNDIVKTKPIKITIESQNINRLLNSNIQYSSIIDARGNPSIYWYHLLYNFKENIYYIQERNIIFIAKYVNHSVELYDVMSESKVAFEEVKSYILKDETNKVYFHFTPDWLDVKYNVMPRKDNALYVYGELLADISRSKFPKTSIT
jgi:hypothetical protein